MARQVRMPSIERIARHRLDHNQHGQDGVTGRRTPYDAHTQMQDWRSTKASKGSACIACSDRKCEGRRSPYFP